MQINETTMARNILTSFYDNPKIKKEDLIRANIFFDSSMHRQNRFGVYARIRSNGEFYGNSIDVIFEYLLDEGVIKDIEIQTCEKLVGQIKKLYKKYSKCPSKYIMSKDEQTKFYGI